jgi:cytochrome c553
MSNTGNERLFSLGNPWFRISVGATIVVVVVSALIGFVWLPSAQKDAPFQGIWNAICSAAGVPQKWLAGGEPVQAKYRTSTAEITPQLLAHPGAPSIGRGATVAMRCTMCHGERGMSEANSPNLAGQYAVVIYKQLLDFQSKARTNAVMSPMAANLSDQEMRDLAAYYASLPRPTVKTAASVPMPSIVAHGAPMRNIASCVACHGGIDNKAGSPWLESMPAPYIKAQLAAFASGARHNDISEQMRNVARQMTPEEMDAAAQYYAGANPEPR